MSSSRVLIVDDQRDIRELLRASLEYLNLDLNIVDVPSGEEGMLVISRHKFDLLITDVRLAGMSGLELVRKVQRRNPDLKVILITGITDDNVRREVAQFGAAAFFYKPVDIVEFQAAVLRALGMSQNAKPTSPEVELTLPSEATPVKGGVLPELLDKLRKDLAAECVWISKFSGEVVIRLGELPEKLDSDALRQAISAALAAQAKVAQALEKQFPDAYLFIAGVDYDLHLINLGWSYGLQAVVSRGVKQAKINFRQTLLDSAVEILPALAQYLEGKPLEKPSEIGEETPPREEDLRQLDDALQRVAQKRLGTQELNNFWEAATDEKETGVSPESGSLSYDQARRLGLTPKELP